MPAITAGSVTHVKKDQQVARSSKEPLPLTHGRSYAGGTRPGRILY
jgi:hypothetical protein